MSFRNRPRHPSLVDNTGGSTDGTLDDIPSVSSPGFLSNAAAQDEVNSRFAVIENNFAELAEALTHT